MRHCRSGEREVQRKALVSLVREHVAATHAAGSAGLVLLDLERPFDYWALTPERRAAIFDDGVHMTEAGYQLMGQLVADGLLRAMGLRGGPKDGGGAERAAAAGAISRTAAAQRPAGTGGAGASPVPRLGVRRP